MIVPMSKYYFVLLRSAREEFLARLQDLGLVDITTTGFEPSDEDRVLMNSIEQHRIAEDRLKELVKQKDFVGGTPFETPEQAFAQYCQGISNIDSLSAQITRCEKEAAELSVWGDFSMQALSDLSGAGVELRYFMCYRKEFDHESPVWGEQFIVHLINEIDGVAYFVIIAPKGAEVSINAQELKSPAMTYADKLAEVAELSTQKVQWESVLARAAASIELIREDAAEAREKLHLSQVVTTARDEAEGTLVILQGWATRETAAKVDEMLEQTPALIYLKSNPTPEDETPVLLRNNKFARLFEFIGNFYALPKYGSMDLTPFFAPFYMMFFGFCLADAGYGLVLVLGGLFLLLKGGASMNGISKLTMLCGSATIVFGLMVGSFFGIQLANISAFVDLRHYFLSTDNLFTLAIGVGIVQILFGMILKVITTTAQFGFKYALSTIGWMVVIVAGLAAFLLPDMGVKGFEMDSVAFMSVAGVGLFMMLFLNSPGKNPFVNFGAGLWNTYNDVTGLLGDILSYIRLFAIGLSGGILAQVFNDLALGLSPDIPVVKQIVVVMILLIGHGINLFMSSLSSFVHPMRLTFVEFYKNAGFEANQRVFTPFKRDK